MVNLTAQLKRVVAELPSHADTLTPKTIRLWLACWALIIAALVASHRSGSSTKAKEVSCCQIVAKMKQK
jgi:hypothetical protein